MHHLYTPQGTIQHEPADKIVIVIVQVQGRAWGVLAKLFNLLGRRHLASVTGDDVDHLFGGRYLQHLVVGMVQSQDVQVARRSLIDFDNSSAGLLSGLGIRRNVEKDDIRAILLEIDCRRIDFHIRDQDLNKAFAIFEDRHNVFSLPLFVLNSNVDHVETQNEEKHLH